MGNVDVSVKLAIVHAIGELSLASLVLCVSRDLFAQYKDVNRSFYYWLNVKGVM